MRNQPLTVSFDEQHGEAGRPRDGLSFCDPCEFVEARYKHGTVIDYDRLSFLYLMLLPLPASLRFVK